MPPGGAYALEAFAVQHVERVAQCGGRALVIRIPPARFRPAAVRVHVLHLDALVQPVLATRAPEAGCLRAAPRRLSGRERVAEVVDPHHSRVETARDPVGTCDVARPNARAEAEARVVCAPDRVILAVE